jgi:hypothetical protein
MNSYIPGGGWRGRATRAILALGALALGAAPAAAADAPEWKFQVTQGETMPSTLIVRNHCFEAHVFQVSAPGAPWVQFDEAVDKLLIQGHSLHTVSLRFESAGLAPGVHRAALLVDCMDCEREQKFRTDKYLAVKKCESPQQRFPIEMTVAAAAPAGGAAAAGGEAGRPPGGEFHNIDAAMRGRMADALARLAGKRGLAVLPESLTVLSLPDGGLVAGVRLAGLEVATAAQLAGGVEVLFLHLGLPAGAGGQAPLQGEYSLLFQVKEQGASGAALLLDGEGATVRELPVTMERMAGGDAVYAAELASALTLPVWCTAPAPGPDAAPGSPSLLWRGWPIRCLPAALR